MHSVLAASLADAPDRQLVHQAAAAIGPDDALAEPDGTMQARGKLAAEVPDLRQVIHPRLGITSRRALTAASTTLRARTAPSVAGSRGRSGGAVPGAVD
ncbi:hypothetical protein [Streptomyces sp. NPDC003730]